MAKQQKKVTTKKGQRKVGKVMREFKRGKLTSGSEKGPKVTSRKQAIAIALSEGDKAESKKKGKSRGKKGRSR